MLLLNKNNFSFVQLAAIEKFIEKNRATYYESLHHHQGNLYYNIPKNLDLTYWLEFWLECLLETAHEAQQKVSTTEQLSNEELSTTRLEAAVKLFQKHKKLKASEYAEICNLGRTQAVEDLGYLIHKKIIKKVGGGRSTVYVLNS